MPIYIQRLSCWAGVPVDIPYAFGEGARQEMAGYPKVYEEVLSELGLDTKEFACWRKFFDKEQKKFEED